MDVSTSNNRETWLFWFLSRPFTLVVRVGEGAQDHIDGRIKGRISPLNTVEASGPKNGRLYQPQKGNLVVLVSFTLVVRVREGAQDHSDGWIKDHVSPLNTVEASGPKIGRLYQPQ
jgi:hypothetical protein